MQKGVSPAGTVFAADIDRRAFLHKTALGCAAVAAAAFGCKKEAAHIPLIGFVNPNPGEKEGAQGFLRAMEKLGYVDGKTVAYIKCETNEIPAIEKALDEMVSRKADLVFSATLTATKIAAKATRTAGIPVLMVLYDAVAADLAHSLIRPGGNVTGLQLRGSTPKALEWLSRIVPGTRKLLVPVCFDTGAAKQSLSDLERAAKEAGIAVEVADVKTPGELVAALDAMPADIGAIFFVHSWMVGHEIKTVLDRAQARRIPTLSAGHVSFDDGLVLSYGPLDDRIGAQAARLADSILHGTPPSSLPVETSKFSLGINLKAARAIGLEISDNILFQADAVIR